MSLPKPPTQTEPKPPIQEEQQLKPGHCLNPFHPIFGRGEFEKGEELIKSIYWKVREIESDGNEYDWIEQLADKTIEIKEDLLGWYFAALKLWRIKLGTAWREKYKSFRQFSEEAIGCTVASVNNKIRAARVISNLIGTGCFRLPLSFSIAYELSKLQLDTQERVWMDICDEYQDHEITVEKVKAYIETGVIPPKLKQVRIAVDIWDRLAAIAYQGGSTPTRLLNEILVHYTGSPKTEPNNTPPLSEILMADHPADPPVEKIVNSAFVRPDTPITVHFDGKTNWMLKPEGSVYEQQPEEAVNLDAIDVFPFPVNQWNRLSEIAHEVGSTRTKLLTQILNGYLGEPDENEQIEDPLPIQNQESTETTEKASIQTKSCKPQNAPIASFLSDCIGMIPRFTQATASNLAYTGSSP